MRPLHMAELLKFEPEQGKILLKGSRVMIFDSTSLGRLRNDLITTLGKDRAKGFLIRYGWSCGFEAAKSIKEQFEWQNELEWSQAGPTMHTSLGFVKVVPLTTECEQESWFLRKGIWVNSCEVEQHILHFDYSDEPVCWMLVGYAGGYQSACLGKKVVYKEIQCAGQGHDHCVFVGKTVEEWGEEIIPELAYYEVDKIAEELEDALHEIKMKNSVLERSVAVHERLTHCLLTAKGVEAITASLTELMNCTVILEDLNLIPQFHLFPDEPLIKEQLSPYVHIWSSRSFQKSASVYRRQKRPFQIADDYEDVKIYRLVSPILVGSELLGFVSLLRSELAFSELDNVALEQAATVYALKILEERKIASIESRLKGDFVDDLLSGNFSDAQSIINRARALPYDITQPHRVLVFKINNFSQLVSTYKQNEQKILDFKTELANIMQSHLQHLGKGITINKSDNLIMLLQLDSPDSPESVAREMAEKIINLVSRQFLKITLSAGIGSCCTQLADFRYSYKSAQKAIEIGKTLKKEGEVISLEQLGVHALLFGSMDPEDLYDFAARQIGVLLEYDETNQAELIPTLYEFLNHHCNVERTAKSMNISLSGLKYRLQRIEEIIGQNPKDPQISFNLQLALSILQVAGKDILRSLLKSH